MGGDTVGPKPSVLGNYNLCLASAIGVTAFHAGDWIGRVPLYFTRTDQNCGILGLLKYVNRLGQTDRPCARMSGQNMNSPFHVKQKYAWNAHAF